LSKSKETIRDWLMNFPMEELPKIYHQGPNHRKELITRGLETSENEDQSIDFRETLLLVEREGKMIIDVNEQEVYLCTLNAKRLELPAPDLKQPIIQRSLAARRALVSIRLRGKSRLPSDAIYGLSSELYLPLAPTCSWRPLRPRRPRTCPFTITPQGIQLNRWLIRTEESDGWRLVIDGRRFGGAIIWECDGYLTSVDGDTETARTFLEWLQEQCKRWELTLPFQIPKLLWEDKRKRVLKWEKRLALMGSDEQQLDLLAGHVAWYRFLRSAVDRRFHGILEDKYGSEPWDR